jgi:FtsH-binding integral membrane protein
MAPGTPSARIYSKGQVGLVIAVVVVAVVLIFFPAYRLFFAVSVGLGLVFAAILYLRNKYAPIKEVEIDNKRPLGL